MNYRDEWYITTEAEMPEYLADEDYYEIHRPRTEEEEEAYLDAMDHISQEQRDMEFLGY